jgi:hypothetical protein
VNKQLLEAYSHLGAALMQTIPADDQIIIEHVREAHAILKTALLPEADPPESELLQELKRIRDIAYGANFMRADRAILRILRRAESAIAKAERGRQ